jgi:hypothetical protein
VAKAKSKKEQTVSVELTNEELNVVLMAIEGVLPVLAQNNVGRQRLMTESYNRLYDKIDSKISQFPPLQQVG